jgi:hypothetical protein
MAGISKCADSFCPSKDHCYRFTAPASLIAKGFADFQRKGRTCKFWKHWRVVACADDEPQPVGHCVVTRNAGHEVIITFVQGLTAHDFCCDSYIPDTAEKTDE